MTKKLRAFAIVAMLAFGTIQSASAQEASADTKASAGKTLKLLSASGYQFKQFNPVVWGIEFTGKNMGGFRVIVTAQEKLVVIFATIAKKDQIPLTPPALQALLHCNHSFDRVKVGLDDDGDAFVRLDVSARVLDDEEFKTNVEQLAAAVDEAYQQIKPFLKAEAPAK